jgi:nucleotide-binding universal stress UspA family protein
MPLSSRAARLAGSGFWRQAARWWRGSRGEFIVRRPGAGRVRGAPVIMVAVDTTHPDDPRHAEMQRETALVLSRSPEFRLICVSAVRPSGIGSADGRNSASGSNLDHLIRLRHWVEPLRLPRERQSLHVIEADNAASAILKFARANHVDLLILGAPGPEQKAMAWWRSVASSVTANAHCSVHVVRVPDRGIADAPAGDAAAQDGGLAGV